MAIAEKEIIERSGEKAFHLMWPVSVCPWESATVLRFFSTIFATHDTSDVYQIFISSLRRVERDYSRLDPFRNRPDRNKSADVCITKIGPTRVSEPLHIGFCARAALYDL